MREIKLHDIGDQLKGLLLEENPVDEDIGIHKDSGELVGVIITPEAYDFFLKKVEEEEDRIDTESVKKFNESGEKNK